VHARGHRLRTARRGRRRTDRLQGLLQLRRRDGLLRKQITLIGSWTFSSMIQADCARFIANRRIDADAIFTHRWTLDQAEQAYRLTDAQSAGKAVFLF
jgi:threonine dehydrogenase-like Zn-dependent dehydrogenase